MQHNIGDKVFRVVPDYPFILKSKIIGTNTDGHCFVFCEGDVKILVNESDIFDSLETAETRAIYDMNGEHLKQREFLRKQAEELEIN